MVMIENLFPTLAILGLGCLAFPLVVGVPLVKRTHWVNRVPQLLPTDDVPEKVQTWMTGQRPQFEALGFSYLGLFVMADFMPMLTSYVGLYRHTEDGLAAMSAWIDGGTHSLHYDEISQLFEGKRGLAINNSSQSSSWQREGFYVGRFPWVQGIEPLWRIHRHLRQQQYADCVGSAVAPGQEMNTICRHIQQEFEDLVKEGVYQRDSQRYVLTWPGAIHMVWRNSFPGKQLHHAQEMRSSRHIASELHIS
jgi:hypothetical protein